MTALPVVRVFVASPGDVQVERDRAGVVAARLATRYAAAVRLETVLWEERFYSADRTFQAHIPPAAESDIVVSIFWGRLGSPLPPTFEGRLRADGTAYESGTVYEVETALAAAQAKGAPDLYVFRKVPAPAVRHDDLEKPEKDEQFRLLEAFWRKWFRDEHGHFLAGFHTFETTDAFEQAVERCLVAWLEGKGLVARDGITWDPRVKGSPFRGLEPFGASHRTVFFGRRRARDEAVRLLIAAAERGCPALFVVANSGLGKSSFLAAALEPRLQEPGIVPSVESWRLVTMRPHAHGPDALQGFATELSRALPELQGGECRTPQLLAARLAKSPEEAPAPVGLALERAATERMRSRGYERPRPVRVLLLLDQAEELFTQPHGSDPALLAALAALVRAGALWLVAALRSELYGRLQDEPALAALKRDGGQLDLASPDESELDEIIAGPAAAAGLVYEDDPARGRLDATLRRAVRGADALPLLQQALATLYRSAERAVPDDPWPCRLTFAAYDRMGGLEGSVEEAAEAAFLSLPTAAQGELPGFLWRTTVEAAEAADRPVSRAVDRAAFVTSEARRQLLDGLEAARLLVGGGEDGRAWVRPAHDALLRVWPRARRILAAQRDQKLLLQRLVPLAEDWQAHGRRDAYRLPPGPLLAGAEGLRRELDTAALGDVAPFVDRSLRLERAARRRRRLTVAGVIAVLGSLAGLATWQWREAEVQRTVAEAQTGRAVLARKQAEEAEAQATQRAQEVQEAYRLAVDTGDRFITGLADRMRRLPGVPMEEIEAALSEGEIFFGDMAKRVGETPALLLSIARMQLSFAETSFHAGNLDRAAARALIARDRLKDDDGSPSRQQMIARTREIEAADLMARREPAAAVAVLRRARDERGSIDDGGKEELGRAATRAALGAALIASGDREDARREAEACLRDLSATARDLAWLLATAHCQRLQAEAADSFAIRRSLLAAASATLAHVGQEAADRPDVVRAMVRLLIDRATPPNGDVNVADLEAATRRIEALLAADPFDAEAKELGALLWGARGHLLSAQGERDRAADALRAARDAWQQMLVSHPRRMDWRRVARDATIDAGEALVEIGADEEAMRALAAAEALGNARTEARSGSVSDALQTARIRHLVGLASKRSGNGDDAYHAQSQAMEQAHGLLARADASAAERQAAKRLWAHALWALPIEGERLSEQDRVEILRDIVGRLEAAAAADPDMWWFRVARAEAKAHLGRALLAAGSREEALTLLLEAGAAYDDRAREILSSLKASGQLDQVPARFAEVVANIGRQRSNRSDTYDVPTIDLATEAQTVRKLFVRNILDDDPYADELHRLREYEGVRLADAVQNTFAERHALSARNQGYLPLRTLFSQASRIDAENNLEIYRAFLPLRAFASELEKMPVTERDRLSPEHIDQTVKNHVLLFEERFGAEKLLSVATSQFDQDVKYAFLRLAGKFLENSNNDVDPRRFFQEALKEAKDSLIRYSLSMLDLANIDLKSSKFEDAMGKLAELVAIQTSDVDINIAILHSLKRIADINWKKWINHEVILSEYRASLLANRIAKNISEINSRSGDLAFQSAGILASICSLGIFKDFNIVVNLLTLAAELEPHNHKYRARLALYLDRLGRHEEAQKQWRLVVQERGKDEWEKYFSSETFKEQRCSLVSDDRARMKMMDEKVTIALIGKNVIGERMFAYLHLRYGKLIELRETLGGKGNFLPSDYGEVIAAGEGEPSEELHAWMVVQYGLMAAPKQYNTEVNHDSKKRRNDQIEEMLQEIDTARAQGHHEEVAVGLMRLARYVELAFDAADPKARGLLSSVLGQESYYLVLVGRWSEAQAAAERALTLDPAQKWIETNLAHALMMQGETERAKALYLGNRGLPLQGGSSTWEKEVLADFRRLREAGIEHPLMAEVEAVFAAPAEPAPP